MKFADVKADNYDESKNSIIACINDAYQSHRYLLKSNLLTDGEKEIFRVLDEYVSNPEPTKTITNEVIFRAVKGLASCLNRYYGQKVIILLDEYDTPMQEALKQIEEKQYDAELLEQGIKKSQTRKIKDKKMHIFFVLVLF